MCIRDRVGRDKFSKTYKFSDINYAVASREDKEAMFLESVSYTHLARTTMTFFVSSSVSTATRPKKGRMNDD